MSRAEFLKEAPGFILKIILIVSTIARYSYQSLPYASNIMEKDVMLKKVVKHPYLKKKIFLYVDNIIHKVNYFAAFKIYLLVCNF